MSEKCTIVHDTQSIISYVIRCINIARINANVIRLFEYAVRVVHIAFGVGWCLRFFRVCCAGAL